MDLKFRAMECIGRLKVFTPMRAKLITKTPVASVQINLNVAEYSNSWRWRNYSNRSSSDSTLTYYPSGSLICGSGSISPFHFELLSHLTADTNAEPERIIRARRWSLDNIVIARSLYFHFVSFLLSVPAVLPLSPEGLPPGVERVTLNKQGG